MSYMAVYLEFFTGLPEVNKDTTAKLATHSTSELVIVQIIRKEEQPYFEILKHK
jgi:hypothetical protein